MDIYIKPGKFHVAKEVARLKQQPGQDILMYGCGELARTLMQHGLIDEYRFWVYPVVVGAGRVSSAVAARRR